MPEISRFFGIIIAMYHSEHAPPHFHARYGSSKAAIAIETCALLEGSLPPRVLGMVMEWAVAHRQELLEDWELCRLHALPKPIHPLE
jgi:hypothetical protein